MIAPIHVEVFGTGPPLIALHGFGASAYTWRSIVDVLAESHLVHAVDLKGAGRAPKPRDGHYSMRDQAEYVLTLIAERQLTDVTLVAHSFGGGVALLITLELQRRRPGTVRSLVLFASPAYRQRLPLFMQVLRAPLLGPLVQWLTPMSMQVGIVLRLAYYDDARIPDESIAAYAAPIRMPGGREALRATALQIEPPDLDSISARYGSIDVPALLIWGEHDKVVPREVGERLHRAIPASRLVVIDDAGHVPHEETPDRVRPLLREFLNPAQP